MSPADGGCFGAADRIHSAKPQGLGQLDHGEPDRGICSVLRHPFTRLKFEVTGQQEPGGGRIHSEHGGLSWIEFTGNTRDVLSRHTHFLAP
jgi:hypothetical protein